MGLTKEQRWEKDKIERRRLKGRQRSLRNRYFKIINTKGIETASSLKDEFIENLKQDYCILVVTHNMQQAARISDYTAFMYQGKMIEFGLTEDMFNNPSEKLTQDYITGSFG